MTLAYIFAYGSLLNPDDWAMKESDGRSFYGYLEDHQRNFEVGIDNLSEEYDKKHYLDEEGRAACAIGTLGVWQKRGERVNGLAIPVSRELFWRIKERERSYYLSDDLRDLFSHRLEKPLFTYYPKAENYEIYLRGKRNNNIFLPSRYLHYCAEGFRALLEEEEFFRLTDAPDYPTRDLHFYRATDAL